VKTEKGESERRTYVTWQKLSKRRINKQINVHKSTEQSPFRQANS